MRQVVAFQKAFVFNRNATAERRVCKDYIEAIIRRQPGLQHFLPTQRVGVEQFAPPIRSDLQQRSGKTGQVAVLFNANKSPGQFLASADGFSLENVSLAKKASRAASRIKHRLSWLWRQYPHHGPHEGARCEELRFVPAKSRSDESLKSLAEHMCWSGGKVHMAEFKNRLA